jgi:hypothetical protein
MEKKLFFCNPQGHESSPQRRTAGGISRYANEMERLDKWRRAGVAAVTVGGGISWYSTSLAVKKCFKAADASLSRVWSFGLKPLPVSYWWMCGGPQFHWNDINVVAVINVAEHDI